MKYTFFTSTGELREETMKVLEERDDRFWIQDYIGAKTVSKSEIDKAVNNPLHDSIRVYTTGDKEQAVSIILREYWKHVEKAERAYKTQKTRMNENLAILEGQLAKRENQMEKEIDSKYIEKFITGDLAIYITNPQEYASFINQLNKHGILLEGHVKYPDNPEYLKYPMYYDAQYPYFYMESPDRKYMSADLSMKRIQKQCHVLSYIKYADLVKMESKQYCAEEVER